MASISFRHVRKTYPGGVTVVPPAESAYTTYLKVADTMLYDAKKHGRNQVVWADEKMRQMWEKTANS